MADKIAMMLDGRIVKFGDAAEVIEAMSGRKLTSPAAGARVAAAAAARTQHKPVMFNKEGAGS
jgi:ABC-type proline/glycine betaine transport system ATPase subunit